MNRSKKLNPNPTPNPNPNHELVLAPQNSEQPVEPTVLSSNDKARLARIMRFLVNVQSPLYAPRARREGYTAKEHKLGWALWRTAAGEDRPLDHWLTERASLTIGLGAVVMEMLKTADAFENKWYPRVRAIIRRVLPEDQCDEFEAAFFQGLEQQPLGPTVVGSVGGLIARVRSLKESSHPHAAKVYAMLSDRGLNETTLKKMEELLKEIEQGMAVPTGGTGNRADVVAAQQQQIKAMRELQRWFNDWATTLRFAFNGRECLALGLSVLRRSASGEEVVEEGEEEEASDSAKPRVAPVTPKLPGMPGGNPFME